MNKNTKYKKDDDLNRHDDLDQLKLQYYNIKLCWTDNSAYISGRVASSNCALKA